MPHAEKAELNHGCVEDSQQSAALSESAFSPICNAAAADSVASSDPESKTPFGPLRCHCDVSNGHIQPQIVFRIAVGVNVRSP
jgi:hypothetical protein